MKSAYELAMERMERESGPSKKLSHSQREEIADIDTRYDAKLAEVRLSYEPKIATAPPPEQAELKQKLAEALADIERERDSAKDKVWNQA